MDFLVILFQSFMSFCLHCLLHCFQCTQKGINFLWYFRCLRLVFLCCPYSIHQPHHGDLNFLCIGHCIFTLCLLSQAGALYAIPYSRNYAHGTRYHCLQYHGNGLKRHDFRNLYQYSTGVKSWRGNRRRFYFNTSTALFFL